MRGVRTVVLGPMPAEVDVLMKRRRTLGLDRFDEAWQGDYHMAPAPHPWHGYLDQVVAVLLDPLAHRVDLTATGPFNLGDADDYRVPDRGLHRRLPATVFVATAALVVEIVSPADETWAKLSFYADHEVDEILIVDPTERSVTWLALVDGRYIEVPMSALLNVGVDDLAGDVTWPTES